VIQPDRAESVMQVEVLIIPGRRDFLVDIVLAEYLPVRVDVFFHNIHIISRIQLHQYYRQLACNVKDPKGVNYVFAFGGGAFGRGFLIDTVAEGSYLISMESSGSSFQWALRSLLSQLKVYSQLTIKKFSDSS
jgi:hypothetical protein